MIERRADDRTPPLPVWVKSVVVLLAVGSYIVAAVAVLLGLANGAITDPVVGIVVGGILQALAGEYKGVLGYLLGSSEGTQAKDRTISRALASSADPGKTTVEQTAAIPATDGVAAVPAKTVTTTERAPLAAAEPVPVVVVQPAGEPVPVKEAKG